MRHLVFALLLFSCFFALSQTDSGNLETYLNSIIENNPGDSGNNYQIPSNLNLSDWKSCINAILSEDLVTARMHASNVNYEIIEYIDSGLTGATFLVLKEKTNQQHYWGTYVFGKDNFELAKVVLQAPHANFDFNTGKQAVYSFVRLGGYALFLNGTHRCNHDQLSSCSGTTSVCSSPAEAFRISDLAHNTNSIFQKTTEIIHDTLSDTVFIQLHGFTKLDSDPYVIISNGTDQNPSGSDYAVQLKDALFMQDNSLTFKVAHQDDWTRLVGFTNTQGRYINQSTNPCNTSAIISSGRFVHLEQEKSKLRDNEPEWDKLFQALDAVFIAFLSTSNPKITIQFTSENPFSNSLNFQVEEATSIQIFSLLGNLMYSEKTINNKNVFSIDTGNFSPGIYVLKVTTRNGFATKKLIRE